MTADQLLVTPKDSAVVSEVDDISLINHLASKGAKDADAAIRKRSKKKENVAEAIENNFRRLVIDETLVNPKFYEHIAELVRPRAHRSAQDFTHSEVEVQPQPRTPIVASAMIPSCPGRNRPTDQRI
jgi:hypothetical protein